MTGRFLSPTTAAEVLALIAAAKVHAPEAPLAWLAGYATRAAGERVLADVDALPPVLDPRREPPEPLGVPVARVALGRSAG